MLTLYHHWNSTCSRRVRICLAEKNLQWESRHVDINVRLEQTEDCYVGLNPNNVVPTLDHDERIVYESNVILEYLDDTFPAPTLRPSDTWERARMRIWMDRSDVVHSNVNKILYNRRQRPQMEGIMKFTNAALREEKLRRFEFGITADDEAYAERRLAEVLDDMETTLARQPWLTGASFSLADISMAPFIERFEANRLERLVDWSRRPAVGDWWNRVKARPSFGIAYAFKDPDTSRG